MLNLEQHEEEDGNNELNLGYKAYAHRQWEKAARHFSTMLKLKECPQRIGNAATLELARTLARMREANTGRYAISQLYEQAYARGILHMDVADYTGPVRIATIECKGRGLVAIRNVQKGTLLLAARAFSISSKHSSKCGDTNSSNSPLFLAVARALQRNEPGNTQIGALFSGTTLQNSATDENARLDLRQLRRICTLNAFDLELLYRPKIGGDNTLKAVSDGDTISGLWILPSYINHSCIENATRTFCGDLLFVHAISEIREGEEITLNYGVNSVLDRQSRAERLVQYAFTCQCRLCLLDTADPMEVQRTQLIKEFMTSNIGHNAKGLKRAEAQLEKIRQTFAHRHELRLALTGPLCSLAAAYKMNNFWSKCVKLLEEAIQCLQEQQPNDSSVELAASTGSSVLPELAEFIMMNIADCLTALGRHQQAREYIQLAAQLNTWRTGSDGALFKQLYPEAAHFL